MQVQLNGNATLIGSKALTDEDKVRVLATADGHVKVVRLTLIDSQGREVVLQGRLYESKSGGLTARFNTKVESCELVEVDEKKQAIPEQDKAVSLRRELGL